MPSPLDRMIMDSVRCLACGAKYGACDCAEKARAKKDAQRASEIQADYERMMKLSDAELIDECRALGVKIPE